MTAWTSISNALVAVGAKPFATTIQALRDNLAAMTEGATGAPRLRIGALERLNPGTEIRVRNDSTVTASAGNVSADGLRVGIMQVGTVTFTFEHQGAGSAFVFRIRGGTESTISSFANGASFVARSVDVGVQPGDVVGVKVTSTIANPASIRLSRMQTNGEDYFPVSISAGTPEGNTYD